uniref:Uncharacterized protein n=1 Tax=Romanomermis culicivorax TaxID=13658 RepID=A0A915I647_ROMCU
MQIEELDDQWCRHLHRSGVPQNDRNLINRLEQRAKGPGTPLADCKHRKILLGILQQCVHDDYLLLFHLFELAGIFFLERQKSCPLIGSDGLDQSLSLSKTLTCELGGGTTAENTCLADALRLETAGRVVRRACTKYSFKKLPKG